MKETDILTALLAAAAISGEGEAKPKVTEKNIREKSAELGEVMRESMLGFVDAGFTEEQAFQLVLAIKRRN